MNGWILVCGCTAWIDRAQRVHVKACSLGHQPIIVAAVQAWALEEGWG